jgi:hypothetical protein
VAEDVRSAIKVPHTPQCENTSSLTLISPAAGLVNRDEPVNRSHQKARH